jgi:hypothetical protein
VLSINTYLETSVFGTFSLGYGRFGPTEARAGLIAVNAAMALGLGLGIDVLGIHATLLDAVGLTAAGGMLIGLGVRAARNLRTLAEREPPATPRAV